MDQSIAETPYWSRPIPFCELISETLDWYSRNPDRASERLDRMNHDLPSGSGIDSGTIIDRDNEDVTNPESSFILASSWHAMDSNGYYAGWYPFNVEVVATFAGPVVSLEWVDEKPEKDYPAEIVDCPYCHGTGFDEDAYEEDEEECTICDGTGRIEDENAEWAGISDPTDYLIDVYSEIMKEMHSRIEYDEPPSIGGNNAGPCNRCPLGCSCECQGCR